MDEELQQFIDSLSQELIEANGEKNQAIDLSNHNFLNLNTSNKQLIQPPKGQKQPHQPDRPGCQESHLQQQCF